jgi:hypothetical protein
MKTSLFALAFAVLMSSNTFAQTPPSVTEITRQIIICASNYANAIACGVEKIEAKDIAALAPYKSADIRDEARYAVLWEGDVGCLGGSGTNGTNISIIIVGTGDSFMVAPLQSSPAISFESPVRYVEKIVGNTRDTLVLRGMDYGEDDPNCCPSIPLQFTMKVDEKGNWKVLEKKVLEPQKKQSKQ